MSGSGGSATLDERGLEAWGERIGAAVATPVFFAIRGDLGAGKSVFARSVARGAGVEGHMPSPTYNLLFEYEGRDGVGVYHLDLYRLNDPSEVWELGWSELGTGRELVLVEWPERAEALLPPDRWELRLDIPSPGALVRNASWRAIGAPPPIPGPESDA